MREIEFWESGKRGHMASGSGKKAHIGREVVKRASAVASGPAS